MYWHKLIHANQTAHMDYVLVANEDAACGELCYVTYGPNLEYVTINMWTEWLCALGPQANKFHVDKKACQSFSTQPATREKNAINYFTIMWWHGKSTNLHIWELKVQTLLLIYHHKLSTVPAYVSGWTAASHTPGYTPLSDTSPACGHTPSLPADAASTGGI